jgi:GNAT superfamily N-acetyltransferase
MPILPLHAVPELADQISDLIRGVWPEHYVKGPGDAQADIAARVRVAGVPFGLVLVEQGQVLGTIALTGPSFGGNDGEDIWVGGLAVASTARGQGYASALLRHLTELARMQKIPVLYTTTADARGIFLRQGWTELRQLPEDNGQWCVLRKLLSGSVDQSEDEKI